MRTNVRVSAVVIKRNQILLIHRRKNGEEYWVVPGGGVEDGETVEEALIREVKEETNLELVKFEVLGNNKESILFKGEKITKEVEHIYYLCELGEGDLKLGGPEAEKNNPNNWFNPEWKDLKVIDNLNLYPEYIKKIISKHLDSLSI